MKDRYKLVTLELIKEGFYYLCAQYEVENDKGVWLETYPRIVLDVNLNRIPEMVVKDDNGFYSCEIDIGFGKTHLLPDAKGSYIVRELIEEKVHEMTLDEIEKKLGYKVKIVNKSDT